MDDDNLIDGEQSQMDGQPTENLETPVADETSETPEIVEADEASKAPEITEAELLDKGTAVAKAVVKLSIKSVIINIAVVTTFVLVFATGLIVMFYPSISNYVNEKNQSRAVQGYNEIVKQVDPIDYEKYIEEARAYNARLAGSATAVKDAFQTNEFGDDRSDEYWDLLSIDGSNVMGYVIIDILDIEVPLYHGTSAMVLSVGAGHIQGSSLPVGGESTHTVVSAHTGLPSARFFDKVDSLVVGDTFAFRVMNEVLTYQVDQVIVVLPEEVGALAIEAGQDYATLVTCTPYGINSHRLLVRGARIETPPEKLPENDEAIVENQPEQLSFLKKAEKFIVEFLAAVVEFVAGGIVNIAEWAMDILGIEY